MHRMLLLVFLFCYAALAAESGLPSNAIPDGLGVNIHFTDPRPGEMQMLAEGGFSFVRMDFAWSGIEQQKGKYNFAAYERLLKELDAHKIRAVFILDYNNKMYDNGLSPNSDAGREAFANWAAESVKHFQGRGVLWEMYNEPNIGFWKPKPNVDEYTRLALATGKAIHAAAPDETYIGPASSTIDFHFLEECFKAGLLEYWSAVSVHPYRQNEPESAGEEYERLRKLIAQYAPKGKTIPILSGEWGYSSAWGGMSDEKQGQRLPREWMTNLYNGVPLSIWYDWHEDGEDPKEAEHHFGTVKFAYHKDRDPVYDAKPAYVAAKTFTHFFSGFKYNKRLSLSELKTNDGVADYALLFSRENEQRIAVWTSSATPHTVTLPASPGAFTVTSHLGEQLPELQSDQKGLTVNVSQSPLYLAPKASNELLSIAATWERAPLDVRMPATKNGKLALDLRNPLSHEITVTRAGENLVIPANGAVQASIPIEVSRSVEPQTVRLGWEVKGLGEIAQGTRVFATNPLVAKVVGVGGDNVSIRVESPSGEPFKGAVWLTEASALNGNAMKMEIQLKADEREKLLSFQLPVAAAKLKAGVNIEDERSDVVLKVPASEYLATFDVSKFKSDEAPAGLKVDPDGDSKISSEQSLVMGAPTDGLPIAGLNTLKLSYRFGAGWKFLRVDPQNAELKKIAGQPKSLGLWIYGDGEGNHVRLRFTDSSGQTFQPAGPAIDWKGWRYIEIPMLGQQLSHWGGAKDGAIHYPIHWDTLFLLDGNRRATQGTIYFSAPLLME